MLELKTVLPNAIFVIEEAELVAFLASDRASSITDANTSLTPETSTGSEPVAMDWTTSVLLFMMEE